MKGGHHLGGVYLPLDLLETMTTVIPLAALLDWAPKIVDGQVRGRVVVDVNA